VGYDLQSTRPDVFRVDARRLPLEDEKADFVFCDPPYSDHIRYSGRPECIGELDARKGPQYLQAIEQVIAEMYRILRPDRHLGLYVCDSARKGKRFVPLGFEIFSILRRYFAPVDVIAVVRRHRTLKRSRWHEAAADGNFFLRGFNYLFVMYKEPGRERAVRPGHRRVAGKSGESETPPQNAQARRPQKRRRPGRDDRPGTSGRPRGSGRAKPRKRKGPPEK
jgi:SAM-dependent methyltransferase